MQNFFDSGFFKEPIIATLAIAMTALAFFVAKKSVKIKGLNKIPPLLIAAAILISFIEFFDIDYAEYKAGGDVIIYLLGPATVALGFPLFKFWDLAKQNALKVALATVVSGVVSIYSTILMCQFFGVDKEFHSSLISKCVTTPVAIEISKMIGGIPELSVCAVFVAGIFGAFFGHRFLKLMGLKTDAEIGMSMGAISHVIGTAKCLSFSQKQGALAALVLVLCAVFTALFVSILY